MNENNFAATAMTQRRLFQHGRIRKFKHAILCKNVRELS